jgi:hypothetical protein
MLDRTGCPHTRGSSPALLKENGQMVISVVQFDHKVHRQRTVRVRNHDDVLSQQVELLRDRVLHADNLLVPFRRLKGDIRRLLVGTVGSSGTQL